MLDAERILRALVAHDVDFLVIGALAATMQGSPLRTDDIDICPDRSEGNLQRLAACLTSLNAREWDARRDSLAEREWTPELLTSDKAWILVTAHGRLDLVFVPAGTSGYGELAERALEMEVGDLVVRVAALDDLIRSKEAMGREQDLAQLPTLRRLKELRERES